MVEIKLKMPDESAEHIKIPVQLPHLLLEYLLCDCSLQIEDDLVRKWWNHLDSVNDDIAVETREFRRLIGDGTGSLCWPLGIHGDEANIGLINNPTNKIIGVTLNIPLFRPMATRISRWLLFAVESERVWSVEETIFPVLEAITLSVNHAIQYGVKGRHFILTEIRGDQAWFRYIFKHKAYWIGNNICFRCKACAKPNSLNYTLNGVAGGWESTVRSTLDFITEELEEPYCCYVVKFNLFFYLGAQQHK